MKNSNLKITDLVSLFYYLKDKEERRLLEGKGKRKKKKNVKQSKK